MQILLRWILSALALYITVYLGQALKLGLKVDGPVSALLAVLVLTFANAVLRPVVQLVALPLSCLTFGLIGVLINALMFWLVSLVVPGFHVQTFLGAVFGAVVMGLVSGVLNNLLVSKRERERERR